MTLDELKQKLENEREVIIATEEELRRANEKINQTYAKIAEYETVLLTIDKLTEEWYRLYNAKILFDESRATSEKDFFGNHHELESVIFKNISDTSITAQLIPTIPSDFYYEPVEYETRIYMLNVRYRLIEKYNEKAENLREELGIDEPSKAMFTTSNVKIKKLNYE